MKKWYNSLLKEIEQENDNIFLIDSDNLLEDKNFLNDLSKTFEVHKYTNDMDYFKITENNNDKKTLFFSNKEINRGFLKNNLKIDISLVFPDLDLNILKNMDKSYYQKIYNYYSVLKSKNIKYDTKNLIFRSVWDIDIGDFYNLTKCLQITLDYVIDKKELDEYIIKEVSKKLNININEFKNQNKFYEWIESIISNYIDEKYDSHKFDLSNNLIQFYLSKIDLNSVKISNKLSKEFIENHPWLSHFKIDPDEDTVKTQIKSYKKLFDEIYDKIYEDNEIDLEDLDDVYSLSKTFSKICYLIQNNDFDFNEFFDLGKYYLKLDVLFKTFVENRIYEQVFEYPYSKKPYTVNNILNHIFYNYKDEKIALVVMDGMSYDEWFILKKYLNKFNTNEMETFAILPTITSFSRTSIFSGKRPNYFIENKRINKNFEKKGFYQYLNDKKINDKDILFGHIDLNKDIIKTTKENIEFEYVKDYKFIGLICNLFDEIAHSTSIYGKYKSNYYNNVKNAIESSNLIKFFENLKKEGYKIIITSDHGNIFSKGNDITQYYSLTFDEKSGRCLIFDDEILADKVINENPDKCVKYNYNIIGNDLFLVLGRNNDFFSKTGNLTITHGSYMPEELVVPMVVLE